MLSALLTSIFSGEAVLAVRRIRVAVIAYAIVAVFALCAAGFLIAAAFIYFSRRYGTLEAALGFGGGFALLAIIVLLVFRITAHARVKRRARRHRGELASIAAASALAMLPALIRGKGLLGLIGLPLATLLATQIYRENAPRGGRDNDEKSDDD